MAHSPDFFLSSAGEYKGLASPRECWLISRLRDHVRDDHMLVQIAPPLLGQSFGLGGKDLTQLILSPRLEGDNLFPINRWPLPVYVSRILDENIVNTMSFEAGQVVLTGWAAIFRTLEEASAHAVRMAE